jgi:hypothetical protein
MEANLNACQKETMACQETTEANPEKTEPNPEMMQSKVEHQEVPTEEVAVKSSGTMKRHGLASSCRAMQRAKGTEPRRLWILEEVGCRLQEGISPCSSGMAQEKRVEEYSVPRKLWTTAEIGPCQNKDDSVQK